METLEKIQADWKIDSKIDKTKLDDEASNVPYLHHKYYKTYLEHLKVLNHYNHEASKLHRYKHEYYNGTISETKRKEFGWPVFALKVLRIDIEKYLNSDSEMIDLQTKIEDQKAIVEYLKDIIKTTHSRGYLIRDMLEFLKFQSGSG